MADQVS